MENSEHFDWEGAELGDYYPLYNPATDKITYLEYKVTKEGEDRGYVLVTLKDDETRVVESSHGNNGTCYELLRDKAGSDNIRAYRFSFASYTAEDKSVSRADGRKILAALGNIEYDLMDAAGGDLKKLTRSTAVTDRYNGLIDSYKRRVEENNGYLDIKKEYGEYLKKQNGNMTRNSPEHKEDKTAEISWYCNKEVDTSKYGFYTEVTSTNTWPGGYYLLRYYFSDGFYQDYRYDLTVKSRVIVLARNDVLKIEIITSQRNGPYDDHKFYFKTGTTSSSTMILDRYIAYYGSPVVGRIWAIPIKYNYPLMRTQQFHLGSGTASGCVPTAGVIIAAYWDKMKGIDMYPGTPTAESGVDGDNQFSDFQECTHRFRDHLEMYDNDNGSSTTFLGNAFYWYGVERGISNPCSYEVLLNIDGKAVENPEDYGCLDKYSYDRILSCLNNNWPVALGYTEDSGTGHCAVVYKIKVQMDSYDMYYNSILSVDTGWWDPILKDLKNVTYVLRCTTLIWR